MRERARLEREISHLTSGPSYEAPQRQDNLVKGGGATPGVGEGIDLIFIMKPTPEEKQKDPLDQFIKDLTKYAKTILLVRQTTYSAAISKDQQYKEIYNVDDIFDHLAWIVWKSQGRERVRRIRIIAHGQMGTGAVKMALRTNLTSGQSTKIEPKRKFVLPSELVEKYVEKPKIKNFESKAKWEDALRKWESNRKVVRFAMTKDALVEFWGCFIGDTPEAGSAWSGIFESTFRATSEEVMTGFRYYTLQRRPPVKSDTVPEDRVHNTREIDRLDGMTQKRFRNWLLERYHEFARNGDILPIEGEKAQIHLMRDIFDISEGDLKYLVVNIYDRPPRYKTGKGRKVRPGDANAWSRVWKDFPF